MKRDQQIREYKSMVRFRVFYPTLAVASVFLIGTLTLYLLGGGRWSLLDAAFFTTITLTTVGYGDTLNVHGDPGLEIFTILLMWIGLLVTLYAVSSITVFLIEAYLGKLYKEHKMLTKISAMRDHYIICGAGTTGVHVIEEFHQTKRPFVVVDADRERLEHLSGRFEGMLWLAEDALEEETLVMAGIERAAGVVCGLHDDSQNMLLTVLCATENNRNLRIISKCIDHDLIDKFKRAGATSVVSPNFIGGLRMASEMVRPHVVNFLDKMLRQSGAARFEECIITEDGQLAGKTLRDSKIMEKTGLRIVAISTDGGAHYDFNPSPDHVLQPDQVCIVIGEAERVAKIRDMA